MCVQYVMLFTNASWGLKVPGMLDVKDYSLHYFLQLRTSSWWKNVSMCLECRDGLAVDNLMATTWCCWYFQKLYHSKQLVSSWNRTPKDSVTSVWVLHMFRVTGLFNPVFKRLCSSNSSCLLSLLCKKKFLISWNAWSSFKHVVILMSSVYPWYWRIAIFCENLFIMYCKCYLRRYNLLLGTIKIWIS